MDGLFAGGHIIDWIVALVAVEAVAVLGLRFLSGRGPAPGPFVCNLLAGTFLLLALRNALAGASGFWIGACVTAALAAHLADLAARWEPRRTPAHNPAPEPVYPSTVARHNHAQAGEPPHA